MPMPTVRPPDKLARLASTPARPLLVEVRQDDAFRDDLRLPPGSFRHSADLVDTWAHQLPGRSVVVVYSKGRDLSHDTAAHLQQADAPAEVWGFGCSPFDIDVSGVFWSPQDKFCTFDVMVEEFSPANEGLPDTVLIRPRDNGALSDLVTLAGASWAFRQ